MDGLYYTFLYIKGDGYPSRVRAGWMSALINAGEGVDIDVHLRRENRSKTIDKVAQRIRLNRTKIKSMRIPVPTMRNWQTLFRPAITSNTARKLQ